MAKFVILLILLVTELVVGQLTRNNNVLDKVTVNDVSANSIASEQRVAGTSNNPKKESSVQITGATVGGEPDVKYPNPRTPSMFSRLIDDIFQIPISVLQSVARLLTNPFTQNRHADITPSSKGT